MANPSSCQSTILYRRATLRRDQPTTVSDMSKRPRKRLNEKRVSRPGDVRTQTGNNSVSHTAVVESQKSDCILSSPVNSDSVKEMKTNRKRKNAAREIDTTNEKKNEGTSLFNGLVLSISTLESKNANDCSKETKDAYNNFKTLSTILSENGATVSPQVHKRVNYLVSTKPAVENLTRRVRQALKRDVDIIDVEWVRMCIDRKVRMDMENFLRNDLAREMLTEKERERAESKKNSSPQNHTVDMGYSGDDCEDEIPDVNSARWSVPIQLDCCCVCHENGDNDCPWCTECNLTLAKTAKK